MLSCSVGTPVRAMASQHDTMNPDWNLIADNCGATGQLWSEDYDTEPSENSGDEAECVDPAQHNRLYPYPPYLGRPYVTSSVLNTLDMRLAIKAIGDICRTKVKCLQLQCKTSSISLQHILFGTESVSFSKISG